MCGIVGLVAFQRVNFALRECVEAMSDVIRHRGPDSSGLWGNNDLGVCIGHRRLAILDPSAAGSQPMLSKSNRFVIGFNGEIYNHFDIRHDLEKDGFSYKFQSRSDTETILAAVEFYGVEQTIKKLVGMFAISIWDTKLKKMYLARDRFGEKPIYYGWSGSLFAFASELKPFKKIPGFGLEIDNVSLSEYFRKGYIPAPLSIYSSIKKLEPGCVLMLQKGKQITVKKYWDFGCVIKSNSIVDSDDCVLRKVQALLASAVVSQSLSDVPIGALLSGGVDSSLVAAILQEKLAHPLKTFTVGYAEHSYDESKSARHIANHLGTDHSEMIITPDEIRRILPSLPAVYDEPFADQSQLPTIVVAQLASKSVKVVLTGDGADEVFGGYNRYIFAETMWPSISKVPKSIRRAAGAILGRAHDDLLLALYEFYAKYFRSNSRVRLPLDKIHKFSNVLGVEDCLELYQRLTALPYLDSPLLKTDPLSSLARPEYLDGAELMMFLDTKSYLPDDILLKVDRATMSVGLEARAPFLDHRLVEYMWSIPMRYKIRGNSAKWILKELLENYIPLSMFDRPKMGFGVPVDLWLKGPLKTWAEKLIEPARLHAEGFLDSQVVSNMWQRYLAGYGNLSNQLWACLMFQQWLEDQ